MAELFSVLEGEPELIYWRQGRCLPYGEGVTYWALTEMIKAHAGILETDSTAQVEEKLSAVVTEALHGSTDRAWVEVYVRRLVGLAEDSQAGGDRRAEAFAAWRRFFEAMAERSPLLLAFEDLHWADDSLLDFIDHLVDWATVSRCSSYARRGPSSSPAGSAGAAGSRTRQRSRSRRSRTTTLRGSCTRSSSAPFLAADVQSRSSPGRAGTLSTRRSSRGWSRTWGRLQAELALPESVQGIIAARLDALPLDEKLLLQDASVVGKAFWLGALERIGGRDRAAAELLLHALERKDFVRRERQSSVGDETQYVFSHLLVRDVAYS